MADDNRQMQDRCATWYQTKPGLPLDVAHYGPDIGDESDLRLLGDLRGKRALELGCGAAPVSVAFAKQGAIALAVESSADLAAAAKRRCEREGVRVELRQGDLADLAFVRADSVDLVFSAYALAWVDDLSRVFRQVHRVLKVGAPLVFSLPHPVYDIIDEDGNQPLLVRRSYFDRTAIGTEENDTGEHRRHHTIADLYTDLFRASYRVDAMLEPQPESSGPRSETWREPFRYVPRTLVIRARKEGN
ncbi:MAG TPA: class I SAM-dependent methyltransferase [Acidimicrobiales bacterium]|nr:class I SAM-dependent methyltransferase [Acidimicrobiales bacterium]